MSNSRIRNLLVVLLGLVVFGSWGSALAGSQPSKLRYYCPERVKLSCNVSGTKCEWTNSVPGWRYTGNSDAGTGPLFFNSAQSDQSSKSHPVAFCWYASSLPLLANPSGVNYKALLPTTEKEKQTNLWRDSGGGEYQCISKKNPQSCPYVRE